MMVSDNLLISGDIIVLIFCSCENKCSSAAGNIMPIVNKIRDELASLKECLNETMSPTREDLEEHKNRTTSELAD